MTEILILIVVGVVVWIFVASMRESAPPPASPGRQGQAVESKPRRFTGRVVQPPAAGTGPPKAVPARSRLRNGRRIPPRESGGAFANGRVFIPDDAIGLGCLAPISECTLGDRCICRGRTEQQSGL